MSNLYFGTIFTEWKNSCKGPLEIVQLTHSKQDHLEQVAWGCAQLGFNCLQGRRFHGLSEVPAFNHPHRKKKRGGCVHIQTEFSVLQFVPLMCRSVTRQHWKESINSKWIFSMGTRREKVHFLGVHWNEEGNPYKRMRINQH